MDAPLTDPDGPGKAAGSDYLRARARPGQRHQPPPLRARPRGAAREQRRGTRLLWVPTLPYLLTNRRPEFHSHSRQPASCGTAEEWHIGKRLLDCPAPGSLSFWELHAAGILASQKAKLRLRELEGRRKIQYPTHNLDSNQVLPHCSLTDERLVRKDSPVTKCTPSWVISIPLTDPDKEPSNSRMTDPSKPSQEEETVPVSPDCDRKRFG